ncbi:MULTISPECIES: hypothetical protein [Bacillus cereus group]|uniref:hypothetical protein n=1 Tax=Bacillus cereus group TaxID=86661 RepID=UPI0015D5043D|nr:hypothetical protein [Bacillus cereus]
MTKDSFLLLLQTTFSKTDCIAFTDNQKNSHKYHLYKDDKIKRPQIDGLVK